MEKWKLKSINLSGVTNLGRGTADTKEHLESFQEDLPPKGLPGGHLCPEEVLGEGTGISYNVFQVSFSAFLSRTIFTDKKIFLKYSYSWLCEKNKQVKYWGCLGCTTDDRQWVIMS